LSAGTNTPRLTSYSHGAGCGCKISPQILDEILQSNGNLPRDPKLLVGNDSRDDAAVYELGNGTALISTTDFFMPIVDDPFDFGRIASANAISDVYAMGGRPLLAIAILGWPVGKLEPAIASRVLEGSRSVCAEAGIPLGGGHSIDTTEPIFGLAVNGLVDLVNIKKNNTATDGCLLYLTKRLGVGILSTAQKAGVIKSQDHRQALESMVRLNRFGEQAGKLPIVKAMTDVTGFGLLGHLLEMCEGSDLQAHLNIQQIPVMDNLDEYLELSCVPGGTVRNLKSYGERIGPMSANQRNILADPQTSGGLLIAVDPQGAAEFERLLLGNGIETMKPIGRLSTYRTGDYRIEASPAAF